MTRRRSRRWRTPHVTLGNRDLVNERPYVCRDNLNLTDLLIAIRELQLYRDAGGTASSMSAAGAPAL